jgi:GntR family transcriptional repressor for pyruvate dehydrogenase complex
VQKSTLRLRPVRARRVFEEITEQIRSRLATGVLRPGDKLPAERALAGEFKVGRNAVREALRTLEMSSVIELKKGTKGGAFIKEGNPNVVAAMMTDQLRLGAITLDHISEMRLWIQPVAARVAVQRATDEDIRLLEKNVAEAEKLFREGKFEQKTEVNIEFDLLLARATHNPVFVPIMDSLMQTLRHFVQRIGVERNDATLRSRRRFLKHLRDRNGEAAAAEMETHLKSVHERYFSLAPSRKATPSRKIAGRKRTSRTGATGS